MLVGLGDPGIDRGEAFLRKQATSLLDCCATGVDALHRSVVGLAAIDPLEEGLFALHIPAAEQFGDPGIECLNPPHCKTVAMPSPHKNSPHPLLPPHDGLIRRKPLPQHAQQLDRREPFAAEIECGDGLLDRQGDGREILSRAAGIFNGMPSFVVKHLQMPPVPGQFAKGSGRELPWKATGFKGLSPASAGATVGVLSLREPGLGGGQPLARVALAPQSSGLGFEQGYLTAGREKPSVQRFNAVGFEPGIEVGERFKNGLPLAVGGGELAASRGHAAGCGAVE